MHGWGCNHTTVQSIERLLSPHFKVYNLDFPGFGGSSTPPSIWGVEEYTQMLEAFIKDENIEAPILIGHSFGGRVSILYASRNKTHKVILVDAAGIKPKRPLKYYLKVYSFKLWKKVLPLVIGKKQAEKTIESYRRKSGSADYNALTGIMRNIMVKVVNEDLKAVLPKIQCPVLLLWGKNDTATPLRDARIMEKLIPDAGLVVFDDAGHYSFLDKPYEFNTVLQNFLQDDIKRKS
jgi:pimeloyl-ACP methyl ester carboxylesterase